MFGPRSLRPPSSSSLLSFWFTSNFSLNLYSIPAKLHTNLPCILDTSLPTFSSVICTIALQFAQEDSAANFCCNFCCIIRDQRDRSAEMYHHLICNNGITGMLVSPPANFFQLARKIYHHFLRIMAEYETRLSRSSDSDCPSVIQFINTFSSQP